MTAKNAKTFIYNVDDIIIYSLLNHAGFQTLRKHVSETVFLLLNVIKIYSKLYIVAFENVDDNDIINYRAWSKRVFAAICDCVKEVRTLQRTV